MCAKGSKSGTSRVKRININQFAIHWPSLRQIPSNIGRYHISLSLPHMAAKRAMMVSMETVQTILQAMGHQVLQQGTVQLSARSKDQHSQMGKRNANRSWQPCKISMASLVEQKQATTLEPWGLHWRYQWIDCRLWPSIISNLDAYESTCFLGFGSSQATASGISPCHARLRLKPHKANERLPALKLKDTNGAPRIINSYCRIFVGEVTSFPNSANSF